jgi:F-type H+-transporting ATPase subunit epsilon
VTLRVSLVVPERELWSGEARTVIAKTTEGDIGVLTGHSPVFGILTEGSVAEILGEDLTIRAAVSGGFLSVAGDRVSILAAQAELAGEVDVALTKQELASALAEAAPGGEDSPAVRYARARLRAAGSED